LISKAPQYSVNEKDILVSKQQLQSTEVEVQPTEEQGMMAFDKGGAQGR
jgi:hypothetical protein